MDLHLGIREGCNPKKEEEHQDQKPTKNQFCTLSSSSSPSPSPSPSNLNFEHMFDKVVTPSDVGKLNRLVIPKQFAEKYFPLKPAAANKGMQLTFEDRTGKQWEFRYSYWNSSQSYVMTRGWSRFVKEKRLDKGDTISFCRDRGRLFIDWHRRPCRPPPLPSNVASPHSPMKPGGSNLSFHSMVPPPIIRWGGEVAGSVVGMPIVVDLVRHVVDRPPEAKRFRLFGVNLECGRIEPENRDDSRRFVQAVEPIVAPLPLLL